MTELKDHTPIAEAQQDFKCSRCTRTDFETKGSTNTMNPRLSFESGRISYFPFKDPELKLTYQPLLEFKLKHGGDGRAAGLSNDDFLSSKTYELEPAAICSHLT